MKTSKEFLRDELFKGILTEKEFKAKFKNIPYKKTKLNDFDFALTTEQVSKVMDAYKKYVLENK